jgi:nucleotide-binding universal stress UspA family protein
MSLKDILVHFDAGPHAATRLAVAVDLARRHHAHLIGLYVTIPVVATDALPSGVDNVLFENWSLRFREQNALEMQGVEAVFTETLRREGLPGEWRTAEGPLAETIALHARYADLAIIGQTNPDLPETAIFNDVIEEVLFTSGRPVLMVPYAGKFQVVGRNVLVGWTPTAEAARALNDAIPLMHGADQITIITSDPADGDGDEPVADIALHLARHGLKVMATHTVSGGLRGEDILLNQAFDIGADLLVMGAYGHSRMLERVLGGVTRGILRSATVPVLMSR